MKHIHRLEMILLLMLAINIMTFFSVINIAETFKKFIHNIELTLIPKK